MPRSQEIDFPKAICDGGNWEWCGCEGTGGEEVGWRGGDRGLVEAKVILVFTQLLSFVGPPTNESIPLGIILVTPHMQLAAFQG